VYGDSRSTTIYAVGQRLDIQEVFVGFEERSVVLHEPVVGRLSRLQRGPTRLAHSRQLNPVSWEPVADQLRANPAGGFVIVEYGE
jgi:hypothetical protein